MTLKSQGRKQTGRQEGNRGTQSKGISFVASSVGDASLQERFKYEKKKKNSRTKAERYEG